MSRSAHGFRFPGPMGIWAVRDLFRRPGETVLLILGLGSLVALLSSVLLLTQSLETTARKILSQGPSLVVRRLGPSGWAPMPPQAAAAWAREVPGVISAVPRVWGTVASAEGPVTVIGTDAESGEWGQATGMAPESGEVLLGPGLRSADSPDTISLSGRISRTFKVAGDLPAEAGIVVQGTVLMETAAARALLGLGPGSASDLAVRVFHDQEAEAILPDLAAAFPWPVRIITQRQAAGRYRADAARSGGLVAMAALPALTALILLVAQTLRSRFIRRSEVGLLKALGWTAGDVIRLHAVQALWICAVAGVLGASLAYGLIHWPGATWPGRLLLGWTDGPPALWLDPSGALRVLVEVAALVLLPFLAASLWPSVRAAGAAPLSFLEHARR